MRFRKFFEMKDVKYEYSSVHVLAAPKLSSEIIAWSTKQIPDEDIFVSQEDPNFGREDDIHVTILYGIHSEKSAKTKKLLLGERPVRIKLGKTGTFTNPPDFDVVWIDIISPDLHRLNRKLEDHLDFTNKYSEYKPHMTLAYVKKGKGKKHGSLDHWEGTEFICDHVIFSSKNGTKEKISLK